MRLGILQPYCFPYLGYFQLIKQADLVILLDNVQFSRPNWINRNYLADKNAPVRFSFPVKKMRLGTKINAAQYSDPERYRARFLRMLQVLYGSAPYFERGRATVLAAFETPGTSVADLAVACVMSVVQTLSIHTPLVRAQGRYGDLPRGPTNLVTHICVQEGATVYINPENGRSLYAAPAFRSAGISLEFLEHIPRPYDRRGGLFFPKLSVLDALMHCSDRQLTDVLESCRIVPAEETA